MKVITYLNTVSIRTEYSVAVPLISFLIRSVMLNQLRTGTVMPVCLFTYHLTVWFV